MFVKVRTLLALPLLAFTLQSSQLTAHAAPISGGIFTTESLCDGTNVNLFPTKDDVYLDGGPIQPGAAGLPDGEYYVQVTEPNGTVLGTSVGAADDTPVEVVDGEFVVCYQLSAILIKASDSTPGYDTTSNNGGEYKVWVSAASDFKASESKTDNFKVGEELNPQCSIRAYKFYDYNLNKVYDEAVAQETLLADWEIRLYDSADNLVATATTDANGCVEFLVDADGATYTVREILKTGWANSTPVSATIVAEDPCLTGLCGDVWFGNYQIGYLCGKKFYDANVNGSPFQSGLPDDVGIPGWMIQVKITLPDGTVVTDTYLTDSGGWYTTKYYPFYSTFEITEIMPLGNWFQTFPASGKHTGTLLQSGGQYHFGNVCLGACNAKTIGFWRNRNGQALIGSDDLQQLRDNLNLVDAAGNPFNPTSFSQFATWLQGATATNMAYMLSAQLAAMKLNVYNGLVPGGDLVLAPGCGNTGAGNNFISVNDLITAANAALLADGYTPSGDPNRDLQECLKDALDDANNNLTFLQRTPCPVVYPDLSSINLSYGA